MPSLSMAMYCARRRARVSGWFLPVENDLAAAAALAQEFVAEPLPLTT